MINFSVDTVRTSLHILAVTVWVGGQIVMLGLLPTLRAIGGDAPKQVAAAFGRVAWPFFGLAVLTGMWNMFSVNMAEVSTGYNAAFGIKILLVVVTGVSAWLHQTTDKPSIRGITGGVGFLASLVVLVLGVLMAH